MKKKEQRINNILELIREQPEMSTKELANILSVSEMTIRRDLNYLRESNILRESMGKKYINMPVSHNSETPSNILYDFGYELTTHVEEKQRIAQKATSFLDPRDIIILDSSTTVSMMVPYLPHALDLTIICYNYHILSQLPKTSKSNLIFTGGIYNHHMQMFESPEGINIIKEHRAKKCFFSTSGIHERLGMTCSYPYEVLTKRASLSSSAKRILLSDSSKFGVVTTSYFAKLSDCDIIITDDGISAEWIKIIENLGIELYIV